MYKRQGQHCAAGVRPHVVERIRRSRRLAAAGALHRGGGALRRAVGPGQHAVPHPVVGAQCGHHLDLWRQLERLPGLPRRRRGARGRRWRIRGDLPGNRHAAAGLYAGLAGDLQHRAHHRGQGANGALLADPRREQDLLPGAAGLPGHGVDRRAGADRQGAVRPNVLRRSRQRQPATDRRRGGPVRDPCLLGLQVASRQHRDVRQGAVLRLRARPRVDRAHERGIPCFAGPAWADAGGSRLHLGFARRVAVLARRCLDCRAFQALRGQRLACARLLRRC